MATASHLPPDLLDLTEAIHDAASALVSLGNRTRWRNKADRVETVKAVRASIHCILTDVTSVIDAYEANAPVVRVERDLEVA